MAIEYVNATQLDSDLTSVANAIRAKSGGSSQLAFPAGFVSEIGNIPSGGGTGTFIVVAGVVTPVSDTNLITINNVGMTKVLYCEAHIDNYENYLASEYDDHNLAMNCQWPKAIVPVATANGQSNVTTVKMSSSSHLDYFSTTFRPNFSNGVFTFDTTSKKFIGGVPLNYIIIGV